MRIKTTLKTLVIALGLTSVTTACGSTPTGPSGPQPSVTLNATPSTVPAPNTQVTLSWDSQNVTGGCTANGDWSGPKPARGSEQVMVSKASTYGMNCPGENGTSASAQTSVRIEGGNPGSSTVRALSIESDQPLAGVVVSAGSLSATTDASGNATFPQALPPGTRLTFTKAGFRTLENVPFAEGMSESLMPSGGAYDDGVFRGLGFHETSRTHRLPDGTRICIVPDATLAASATAMQYLRTGVDWAKRDFAPALAQANISLEVVSSPDGGCFQVPARIDGSISNSGEASVVSSGGVISSAGLVFQRVTHIDAALAAHETGHVLGLGHTTGNGIMRSGFPAGLSGFDSAERLVVKWLYRRLPGTFWEDRRPQ